MSNLLTPFTIYFKNYILSAVSSLVHRSRVFVG